MKIGEAIRLLMKRHSVTQVEMAKLIGVKGQTVISERIRRENMSVEKILQMIDPLGYQLVIQPKNKYLLPGEIKVERGEFV